jgi:hypothetical protein
MKYIVNLTVMGKVQVVSHIAKELDDSVGAIVLV